MEPSNFSKNADNIKKILILLVLQNWNHSASDKNFMDKIKYHPSREIKLYITYLFLFTLISGFLLPYVPESYRFNIIRAGILVIFFVLFFRNKRQLDKISKVLLFFSLYILIMNFVTFLKYGQFSTTPIKILFSSLFFIIGFNLIETKEQILYLSKVFFYGLVIFISIIVLFNVLGIAPTRLYIGMEMIYLGSHGVNTTKDFPFLLFPTILYFLNIKSSKKRKRLFVIVVILLSIILLLIAQKRGAMLGLGFGLLTYFVLSPSKTKNTKIIIFISLLAFFMSPFYIDTIVSTFKARQTKYSFVLEPHAEEWEKLNRYKEIERTFNDYRYRSAFEILFGPGFKSEFYRYYTRRMLHTDYIMFLDGTGVFGLLLYLYIYNLIFIKVRKSQIFLYQDEFVKNINAIIAALVIVSLFVALSGLSHSIAPRAYFMLFTGSAIGFLFKQYRREQYAQDYNNGELIRAV